MTKIQIAQKEKSIELLKKLDIYKPYIDEFEKNDVVCYFERYAGFWGWQKPEVMKKKEDLEQKNGIKIYAITHELTHFGEMWSFLYVSKYKSDWKYQFSKYNQDNEYVVSAYVWNVSDDWMSEFGNIAVRSFGGGIIRIA